MRFLKSDISSTLAGMRIELNEHEVKWSVAVGLVLRKTRKQGASSRRRLPIRPVPAA